MAHPALSADEVAQLEERHGSVIELRSVQENDPVIYCRFPTRDELIQAQAPNIDFQRAWVLLLQCKVHPAGRLDDILEPRVGLAHRYASVLLRGCGFEQGVEAHVRYAMPK